MRVFKVALKPLPEDPKDPQSGTPYIFFKAEDFNTEQATDKRGIYFNFWVQPEGEDAFSVGAVPFENVRYIVVEH